MSHSPIRPMFFTFLAVIMIFLVFAIPMMMIGLIVADSNTTIIVNGEEVLIGEFRPEFIRGFLPIWPFALLLTFGFWRRKSWARHAFAGLCLLPALAIGVLGIVHFDVGAIVVSVLTTLLAWWYFYRKSNVVHYFGAT